MMSIYPLQFIVSFMYSSEVGPILFHLPFLLFSLETDNPWAELIEVHQQLQTVTSHAQFVLKY